MSRIYKLLSGEAWQAARAASVFTGAGVDVTDGYIHFSTGAQAAETARRYYQGVEALTLLEVEGDDLGVALKWEPSRGGDLFPHLYGDLPVRLVREVRVIPLDAAGVPVLPELP